MQVVFTTKTGVTVTATPSEMMPATWLDVTIDGKPVDAGHLMAVTHHWVSAEIAKRLREAGATHCLVCGKKMIAVMAEAAAQIQAAQSAASSRPASLESQREVLVAAVQGAGDEWSAAREAAFDEDTGRGWDKVSAASQKIKDAEKTLVDFDQAHPEVIAKITDEKRLATERFLATN